MQSYEQLNQNDKNNIDNSIMKIKEIMLKLDEDDTSKQIAALNSNTEPGNKIKIYKKNLDKYCEYLGWYELENSINISKYRKCRDILRAMQKKWILETGSSHGVEKNKEYQKIKNKMGILYDKINQHMITKNKICENIKQFKNEIKNLD